MSDIKDLKARDTRRAYTVENLPEEWAEALERADYGVAAEELDADTLRALSETKMDKHHDALNELMD